MLLAGFLSLTNFASSQAVRVEIIGTDTFPLATVYHGTPVSVYTDNQTTTLAQWSNDIKGLRAENHTYRQKEVQYKNIIAEQKSMIDTIQSKLNDAEAAGALRKQNEDDLKKNLKDAASKYNALQTKSNLRIGLSVMGSFFIGSGVGSLIGFLFRK